METDKKHIKILYKKKVHGIPVNTNHTVQFNVTDDKSTIIICNHFNIEKKYVLKNFHYHDCSENAINGVFQPLEIHFVHEYIDPVTTESDLYIMGILVKIGENNLPFVDVLTTPSTSTIDTYVDLSILNSLYKDEYYYFRGTLTTPPFTTNLGWTLFSCNDVRTIELSVDEETYKKLLLNYQNNRAELSVNNKYRNSKPLNNNFLSVTKYIPK